MNCCGTFGEPYGNTTQLEDKIQHVEGRILRNKAGSRVQTYETI